MMKRVISLILTLCLLWCLPVAAHAAAPGSNDVETPEAFLNRLVSGCVDAYDCEKLDGADPAYMSYASVLQHSMFDMLSGLHLETYGMTKTWDKKLQKNTLSYADAKWLCENILNWPAGAWEDMLQQAEDSNGYLGPYKLVQVKDGYVACDEAAGLAMGTGIQVVARRQDGNRLDMVFDYYRGSHNTIEPATFEGRFYAELEQKDIGGKKYWTVYRINQLGDSDNPMAVGGFSDVLESDYYADAVVWAVEKNITAGLTATTFGPTNTCTRAQIVTFLWRAKGSPKPTTKANFSDVSSGEYYADAVSWAVENGITSGKGNNKFDPTGQCTRAEAMTFLWRAEGMPTGAGTSFGDVPAGEYYAEAVRWATGKEITSGTSTTTFSPGNTCQRGQIVTFLYRCENA